MNERKCMSCGENPAPRGTGRFPSAVIEINNPPEISVLRKVVIPASMGTEDQVPATIGKYRNVLLHYEANGHNYLYSSDGIPTRLEADVPQEIYDRIEELEDGLGEEATTRAEADAAIEQEIEDLKNSPDVVDIVPTYAALQAYDTSKLGDNDIIRVLQDEQHDGQSSYYRWDKTTSTWTFIGTVGDYYTKTQTDALLADKQDELTAGQNIQITNNTISATDTTYTAGTGLNLNNTEFSVDTTVIAEKSDIPTVVQTTGTSTTDVMSQNATTKMVYSDPETKKKVVIGGGTVGSATDPVAIGRAASVRGNYAVAIGSAAGNQAANAPGAISLGAFSMAGTQGQMDISLSNATSQAKAANGYAGSGYRLLTGLYDPQNAHDAATKGYVDPSTDATAPTASTTGRLGEIRIDTSTNTAYMCVSANSTTSTYEWKQITA